MNYIRPGPAGSLESLVTGQVYVAKVSLEAALEAWIIATKAFNEDQPSSSIDATFPHEIPNFPIPQIDYCSGRGAVKRPIICLFSSPEMGQGTWTGCLFITMREYHNWKSISRKLKLPESVFRRLFALTTDGIQRGEVSETQFGDPKDPATEGTQEDWCNCNPKIRVLQFPSQPTGAGYLPFAYSSDGSVRNPAVLLLPIRLPPPLSNCRSHLNLSPPGLLELYRPILEVFKRKPERISGNALIPSFIVSAASIQSMLGGQAKEALLFATKHLIRVEMEPIDYNISSHEE